ncbi:hypothetical protein [Streptomyces sp. B6B3]|uniref:hypothetical protein n=1 Tax=Streptomyces sp. B6B3 TaxID=3153570 RepID=UPI00325C7C5D
MRIPAAKLKDMEGGDPPPPVRNVVELADGSGAPRAVAYVERELPPGGIPAYLAARGAGGRSFALWADEHRGSRVATLVTQSAHGGVATYQVLGADGEVIGTLVREKALRGRGIRTRWTVKQPGVPEAVGYKGRIFWWYFMWLLSPLFPFAFLGAVFNNGDMPRAPRRIRWRAGGRLLLDFRPFTDRLRLCTPEVDWRLGAALLALLRSDSGWTTAWDARGK